MIHRRGVVFNEEAEEAILDGLRIETFAKS